MTATGIVSTSVKVTKHCHTSFTHEIIELEKVIESQQGLTVRELGFRECDRSGMQGLSVTRIQHYRDLYERQLKY